jgi:hypothetical protein
MKTPDEEVVAEAARIEYDEHTGDLFIVFKITNEKYKQKIKKTWTQDIEYRIIEKNLVMIKE